MDDFAKYRFTLFDSKTAAIAVKVQHDLNQLATYYAHAR